MASAAGIAVDQTIGTASNVAHQSNGAACDVSAKPDSASGAGGASNYVGIDVLGKAVQIVMDLDPDAVTGRSTSSGMQSAVKLDTLMKMICKLQEGVPTRPGDIPKEVAQSKVWQPAKADTAKDEREKPPAVNWVLADPLAVVSAVQGQGPMTSEVNKSTSPHNRRGIPAHRHPKHHMPSILPTPTSLSPASKPLTRFPSRMGPSSKTSPYRGVSCYKRTGRWEAHIWHAGRQVHLGTYSTAQEAAKVYDIAAIKLRGWSADLNFDVEDYKDDPALSHAPMQLDKNSEEQNIADMVMGLKRRSKGYGGRGGQREKQGTRTLDPANDSSTTDALPAARESCWVQHIVPGGSLNVNQARGKNAGVQLQAPNLGTSLPDTSQRLAKVTVSTNEGGGYVSRKASTLGCGPLGNCILEGGNDLGQQPVSCHPGGRVIVCGPDGNLFMAWTRSNPGLTSPGVVVDGDESACWDCMAQGYLDQGVCGMHKGAAMQIPLARVLSNGRSTSTGQQAQGILLNPQTGAAWRGDVVLGLSNSPFVVMEHDRLGRGSMDPCAAALDGKPNTQQSSISQPGTAAYWPPLKDKQTVMTAPKIEHPIGTQGLCSSGVTPPQGHPTLAVQPVRCIVPPFGQNHLTATQVLPQRKSRLVHCADVPPSMTAGQLVSRYTAEREQGDGGNSRIARLMQTISNLPVNNVVKPNGRVIEMERNVQGQGEKGASSGENMDAAPPTASLCTEAEAAPICLSHGRSQGEVSGVAPESARSEVRTPRSGHANSGTPLLSDKPSPTQTGDDKGMLRPSSMAVGHVATEPLINTKAVACHLDAQGMVPPQSVGSEGWNKACSFIQLTSSLHSSQHNRQEGSQPHGEGEETDDDLLAAEQLCALATAECSTTAVADNLPEHCENCVDLAARDDWLPMWQGKKPRTNSYVSGRQDFKSLQSVPRQSSAKSLYGERVFLDAVLQAQPWTQTMVGRQGAQATVGKGSVSAFKRKRLDGGIGRRQPGGQAPMDAQMVDRWIARDTMRREAEGLCLARHDGRC